MSHLALLKHETQAIKNPPPTFQTVSLGTRVNKPTMPLAPPCNCSMQQKSLVWGRRRPSGERMVQPLHEKGQRLEVSGNAGFN
jgi:hypothetical protein